MFYNFKDVNNKCYINVKYENDIEGIKSVYSSNINKLLEYYSHRINHREIICYILIILYYIYYVTFSQ